MLRWPQLQMAHWILRHRVSPPRYPHSNDQGKLRRKEARKDIYPRTMPQSTDLHGEGADSAETATISILQALQYRTRGY